MIALDGRRVRVRSPQLTMMDEWFSTLAVGACLPSEAGHELEERGFVVLPGPVSAGRTKHFARAYDAAVASAAYDDVRTGRTSTRVSDFVNRGAEFDGIYIFPPLLEACCRLIGRPFKLSSLHARTLRSGAGAQALHTDVRRDSADWPLVGFKVAAYQAPLAACADGRGFHWSANRWTGKT